jgi:protein-S-isoprenylcysteine O-methyltransferase Ste14
MDALRYCLAVGLVIFMPALLLYWLLLHPFVRFWRRLGAGLSLAIIGTLALGGPAVLSLLHEPLVGADLGTNMVLIVAGLVCVVVAGWLRRQLGRQFRMSTLAGLPELTTGERSQRLITENLHGRVRHPRYLQLLLALLGWALMANYAGPYLLLLLFVPGVWVIVVLEERELRQRFGADYEAYCRRVPRFLPRSRSTPFPPRSKD